MKTIVDYCNICYDTWKTECTKLANKIIPAVDDMLVLRVIGKKGIKDIKPISVPKRKFTPMYMAGLAHDIYSKGGEI